MHFTKLELVEFLKGKLTDPKKQVEISSHIEKCEFCKEFCENYNLLEHSAKELTEDSGLSERAVKFKKKLLLDALGAKTIKLLPLNAEIKTINQSKLAAHGREEEPHSRTNIVTLYSENPEVVMRLVNDVAANQQYLQLISEDRYLSNNVLVQIPELNQEFLTDDNGTANVDLKGIENLEKAKWQIKMPDAVFELERILPDAYKPQYSFEKTFESEQGDKINVRLEGHESNRLLSIEVVKLAGESNIADVKIGIKSGLGTTLKSAQIKKPISFGPVDINSTIQIRLYQ